MVHKQRGAFATPRQHTGRRPGTAAVSMAAACMQMKRNLGFICVFLTENYQRGFSFNRDKTCVATKDAESYQVPLA